MARAAAGVADPEASIPELDLDASGCSGGSMWGWGYRGGFVAPGHPPDLPLSPHGLTCMAAGACRVHSTVWRRQPESDLDARAPAEPQDALKGISNLRRLM